MSPRPRSRGVGILTSGGDCPGLNAAIRAVAKAAIGAHGAKVVGVLDGFRGLVESRVIPLDVAAVSGILTHGGTILGTSRDKPHKMQMGGRVMDMTATAVDNARRLGVETLVCLGGGGTQKNALALQRAGLDVLTLPKTIDNDVWGTDVSFGFDTALSIATEAIDRLHTTATSHNRLIVCEVMGHNAGWLALGAGVAGGADVVLIPEIPYDLAAVAEHLRERRRHGKRFSILVVSEGARSIAEAAGEEGGPRRPRRGGADEESGPTGEEGPVRLVQEPMASRVARQLQQMTGTEARVTSLGHVQRGGGPTAADRVLCTRLGTRAAELLAEGVSGAMVAARGDRCEAVPLEEVAGRRRTVPLDHPWIEAARLVETCLGDR